ncbi:uncharacterized protein LOC124156086 [Ischnura elegans]|uniref:uncharacterized protein LOC124156086 n=1 Tax=Ischnura elegans TaxID=197161 RepID=UPI001ED87A8A|nr:uncharacterized protein LOC124156086 [Ischnura elegans]
MEDWVAEHRMDLDLDYLEKREGGVEDGEEVEKGVASVMEERIHHHAPLSMMMQSPEEQSPADTTDLVKVILLGAPAVGKTSIIQQFVWNEFCDTYYPTDRRHTYYPSVVINGRLYDLKISDLPPVPYFPVDSLLEWTDFRSYGLRSATAYVLVFDLSNPADTFRHIKCLREQMAGSRDMRNVPVVVVGNKHDRLPGPVGVTRPHHPPGSFFGVPHLAQASGFGLPGTSSSLPSPGSSGQHFANQLAAQQHGSSLNHANSMMLQHHINYGQPTQQPNQQLQQQNAATLAESRERRDIANIVKKHWRCGYVECSAKYNWRVVAVFKELMQAVDALEGGKNGSLGGTGSGSVSNLGDNVPLVPGSTRGRKEGGFHLHRHHRTPMVVDNLQEAIDRSKCEVL